MVLQPLEKNVHAAKRAHRSTPQLATPHRQPPNLLNHLILRLASLTFPASPEDLFGRAAPLIVEIGVGSGGFIHALAAGRPDLNVLGVDRAPQSIARSYRRLRHGGMPNVRLFKGNAEWILRNVIPPGGLHRVYVNFPDPWPRKKHHHRRLLNESFLRLLSSRLAPDGDLLVTTDHESYFDFVLRSVEVAGCYHVDVTTPPPEVLATKWARKASSYHHAVLRPTDRTEIHDIDIHLAAGTMYHAVIEGDLPDLAAFEKRTMHHDGCVIVLKDAFRPIGGSGFVFLVHVEEDGLSQEVIVDVREGKRGYVVELRRFGEPLHTRGLSVAVRLITEWLAAQGMTIINKKY